LLFGFPNETMFLPYFIMHQSDYGDLTDDRMFLKLWNDMKRSVPGRVVSGPERIPLPERWREHPRTAASIFNLIMLSFAANNGKPIWCEKSPMHVHHLRLLGSAFPNARFIHVIRDGRDCAASFHRRWKFNPVRTVHRWKRAVADGKAQGSQLAGRYLEVRYEEVTTAPASKFREICAFLSIPFEESVLLAARVRPEMSGSSALTIERNQRRASDYFTTKDLEKLERVAGRVLSEHGYICSNATGDQDPPRWALRYWEMTDDLRRLVGIATARGRLFRPDNWQYVIGRARRRLKQKASLKS